MTGDRAEVAEAIGAALGIDGVLAEQTPEDKVEAVRAERREAVTLMVGDGINDAPALAAADVGIAMGARGSGASSEAADVVLLVDRLDRLADALEIARGARGIALQSVLAGMGMSVAAMVVAAVRIAGSGCWCTASGGDRRRRHRERPARARQCTCTGRALPAPPITFYGFRPAPRQTCVTRPVVAAL